MLLSLFVIVSGVVVVLDVAVVAAVAVIAVVMFINGREPASDHEVVVVVVGAVTDIAVIFCEMSEKNKTQKNVLHPLAY